MKKIINVLSVIFMVYVIGLLIFIVYSAGILFGRIKVIGKVPRLRPKMMMIYNHPDLGGCLLEVFLAAMPFYSQIFLHPFRFAPYFTPDRKNFTDKWYWFWLKARAISISRDKGGSRIKELREMISVLRNFNGCIMHFFEGGRTRTGKSFMTSKKGSRIRTPADSVGWMVNNIKARVLPIWMSNGIASQQLSKRLFSWPHFNPEPIIIKMGIVISPWESKEMDAHGVTEKIALSLLELADQE